MSLALERLVAGTPIPFAGNRVTVVSPELAERLESCEVDTAPRSEAQPSDHTPVIATLR